MRIYFFFLIISSIPFLVLDTFDSRREKYFGFSTVYVDENEESCKFGSGSRIHAASMRARAMQQTTEDSRHEEEEAEGKGGGEEGRERKERQERRKERRAERKKERREKCESEKEDARAKPGKRKEKREGVGKRHISDNKGPKSESH